MSLCSGEHCLEQISGRGGSVVQLTAGDADAFSEADETVASRDSRGCDNSAGGMYGDGQLVLIPSVVNLYLCTFAGVLHRIG